MMHGRFHRLLGTLVLFFLAGPFFQEDRQGLRVLGLVFAVVVVVGILDLGRDRRALRLAIAVGAPIVLIRAVALTTEYERLLVASHLVTAAGLVLALIAIYRVVVDARAPVRDRIGGAICVYLLIGLLWALAYSSTALVQPGSFRLPESGPEGVTGTIVRGSEHTFVYFSFVTLTTLGYGEIRPASSFARTLTWMEAVTGVLFIAITIARLVGRSVTDED